MNSELKMPDLSATGSAMTLLRWLVQPGESVRRGQSLLEVETDKATMEVESAATGVLREARVGPGASVCAGEVVAVIEIPEVVMPKPPTASAASSPVPTPGRNHEDAGGC